MGACCSASSISAAVIGCPCRYRDDRPFHGIQDVNPRLADGDRLPVDRSREQEERRRAVRHPDDGKGIGGIARDSATMSGAGASSDLFELASKDAVRFERILDLFVDNDGDVIAPKTEHPHVANF